MQKPSDSTRLDRLEVQVETMVQTVASLAADFKDFAGKYQSARTLSIQHIGILVMALATIGGVCVSYLNTRIAPIERASVTSQSDRQQLNDSLRAFEGRLAIMERADSSKAEQLKEVETQIKGLSDISNLRDAQSLTYIALLWKRTYGDDFPINAYYPQPKVVK